MINQIFAMFAIVQLQHGYNVSTTVVTGNNFFETKAACEIAAKQERRMWIERKSKGTKLKIFVTCVEANLNA